MQQPEVYISRVAALLGPNGEIVNPSTRDFLTKAMVAFSDWVELFLSVHASV